MDLEPRKYSCEEHIEMRKKLVGSLVRMSWGGGCGLVLNSRLWTGEIHLRIAWLQSPFINFQEERSIGWHQHQAVSIISQVTVPIPI
ncbi:MAG: hypothetical protein GOVbin703_8 [Prokaryotic dsDNA virus sp.]|nr:MAG: hypothetical protein GOVbin703_8 [Prokaryotic dsDNA virus sp.]|tara:strand:+ start:1433 stop:1693 length:261 start_codon:yes stop_codon:yes gene_type:complete